MEKKKEAAVAAAAEETKEKVQAAAEPEVNVKQTIIECLKKTKRAGVEDLIAYMEDSGFFTAPASGGNHSHQEGGLAQHSLNVLNTAEKIGVALLGGAGFNQIRDSVVLTSLLHDLGKCGDYGKAMYVKNLIKDGRPTKAEPEQKYKLSESKPYKRNPDLLPIDHAVRSLMIVRLFMDLDEQEEFAIRYHDGLYEVSNMAVKGHETQLYMILHTADLWSAKIIEGETSTDEKDGE